MFTDTFLRLALVALFGTASGMSCIALPGCAAGSASREGPDFFVSREKPPAIVIEKGLFGTGKVVVDTAFTGGATLTPEGKITSLNVSSDPVVVEEARRDTAIAVGPLLQDRWASIERREEANRQFASQTINSLLGFAGVLIGQGRDATPLLEQVAQITAAASSVDFVAGAGDLDALLGVMPVPVAPIPADATTNGE